MFTALFNAFLFISRERGRYILQWQVFTTSFHKSNRRRLRSNRNVRNNTMDLKKEIPSEVKVTNFSGGLGLKGPNSRVKSGISNTFGPGRRYNNLYLFNRHMFLKKGKNANWDMKYPIRAYLEIREIESFSWTHRPSENENRKSSFLSMVNILNVPALQFWTERWRL